MSTMRRVPGGSSGPLNKMLIDLEKANVRVGWFESSKYNDANQTPVAYVAAINELGPHARPFMRTTAEARDTEWAALMFNLSKQVVRGALTVEQALDGVGLMVGADIQKTIATITTPPLSIITLMARKYRMEHPGAIVTGKTIGEFAAYLDHVGAEGVDVSGVSTKPLNDSGHMLATVSSSVNNGSPKQITGSDE
jgi:hypothetical protein